MKLEMKKDKGRLSLLLYVDIARVKSRLKRAATRECDIVSFSTKNTASHKLRRDAPPS